MQQTHLKLYQKSCDPQKIKELSKRISDCEVFKSILAFLEIQFMMRMQACYKRWYNDTVPDVMGAHPIFNYRLNALIKSNPLDCEMRFKFEFEALMPPPLEEDDEESDEPTEQEKEDALKKFLEK